MMLQNPCNRLAQLIAIYDVIYTAKVNQNLNDKNENKILAFINNSLFS